MAEALVTREDLWDGDLPAVCVKTGRPAQAMVATTLERLPPWTYLLLLAGILPFLVAVFFARERVAARVPVTREAIERHDTARRQVWLGLGGVLLGLLLAVGVREAAALWLVGAGVVWTLIAEIRRARCWISGEALRGTPFVELRRVHPAFATAALEARRTPSTG